MRPGRFFLPRERDFVALLHDVLVCVCWQRPHQAEVSDLHHFVGGQQDVAGSQVPVEETLLLQVGHTARHLHTHTHTDTVVNSSSYIFDSQVMMGNVRGESSLIVIPYFNLGKVLNVGLLSIFTV